MKITNNEELFTCLDVLTSCGLTHVFTCLDVLTSCGLTHVFTCLDVLTSCGLTHVFTCLDVLTSCGLTHVCTDQTVLMSLTMLSIFLFLQLYTTGKYIYTLLSPVIDSVQCCPSRTSLFVCVVVYCIGHVLLCIYYCQFCLLINLGF